MLIFKRFFNSEQFFTIVNCFFKIFCSSSPYRGFAVLGLFRRRVAVETRKCCRRSAKKLNTLLRPPLSHSYASDLIRLHVRDITREFPLNGRGAGERLMLGLDPTTFSFIFYHLNNTTHFVFWPFWGVQPHLAELEP